MNFNNSADNVIIAHLAGIDVSNYAYNFGHFVQLHLKNVKASPLMNLVEFRFKFTNS